MRIAFYAPMKPPDHPTPSGDRRMARLLVQALSAAGHDVTIACSFRSRDTGDPKRQRRIAEIGSRLADGLGKRYGAKPAHERPQAWFTYHLYYKAPDYLGRISATRSESLISSLKPHTLTNARAQASRQPMKQRRKPSAAPMR